MPRKAAAKPQPKPVCKNCGKLAVQDDLCKGCILTIAGWTWALNPAGEKLWYINFGTAVTGPEAWERHLHQVDIYVR